MKIDIYYFMVFSVIVYYVGMTAGYYWAKHKFKPTFMDDGILRGEDLKVFERKLKQYEERIMQEQKP